MTSQVINELRTLDLADDSATARRHCRRAQGTVDNGHLTDQITAHPDSQERLIAVLQARNYFHKRVEQQPDGPTRVPLVHKHVIRRECSHNAQIDQLTSRRLT
jgi:hypothetical protein